MIAGDAYLPVTTNPSYVTATMPDDGSSVFPTALVIDEASGVNWEGGAASFVDGLASDYSDMQVTLADGETAVPFGVEEFSQTSGSRQLVVHLGIPSLSAAVGTELLLWRGVEGGPFEDRSGVYSDADGYCGVWPLNEQNTGAATGAGLYADWTGNTSAGADYVTNTGKLGVVGRGQQFTTGGSDHIVVPYNNKLDATTGLTISAWMRPTVAQGAVSNIAGRDVYWGRAWVFSKNNQGVRAFLFYGPGGLKDWQAGNFFVAQTWVHVVLTYQYIGAGTSVATLYANGQQDAQASDLYGPLAATENDLWIGAREYGGGAEGYFDGAIDDFQLHRVARSADWVATYYAATNNNDAFWTVGEETGTAARRYPAARRAQIYRLGPRLVAGGILI